MLPIGLFEIILTLCLALVILGPDKLFVVARYLGLALRKVRLLYTQLTDEFDKQLRMDEMMKSGELKQTSKSSKSSTAKSKGQNKNPAQKTAIKSVKKKLSVARTKQ